MAQKKKSNKNRQGNLPPLPPKQPKVSRQPTVEDVTDAEEDSEDDDFIPMDPIDSSDLSGDESEIEMESDDEDGGFKEIQSDAELMAFASRLQKAHDQMVKEEKEKRATKKWKATYLGNSDRSKWRWRLEGKKTEAAGFPSVMKFFLKKLGPKQPLENLGSPPEVSIPTAQSYEKSIKQIKNQQEIIASLPKDSHNINPEAVAEQEAEPDTIVSDNEDQSNADLETLDHRDLPALRQAKAELEARHKKKNLDLFF